VYDPDEATKFVADHLPDGTQSRLTYDELQKLLVLHMRWMHEKGLQPSDVIDRKQGIDSTLVVGEETLTAYLLGKAEESNIDVLDDVDVVHVVRAHLDYFEAIGAVGPSASTNDL
jgi:YD repeat-containing protein